MTIKSGVTGADFWYQKLWQHATEPTKQVSHTMSAMDAVLAEHREANTADKKARSEHEEVSHKKGDSLRGTSTCKASSLFFFLKN